MSRKNGGIIGPANTPVGGLMSGVAGGVWRMNDVLDFVSNSQWPLAAQNIENSCRFNGGDSDDLERTPSSSGNNTTNTVSVWLKRAKVDQEDFIIYGEDGSTNRCKITFLDNNKLQINTIVSSSNNLVYETNRLFRDTNAWYHIVIAFDSTLSTAGDRCRLYVNGVEETSFATETDMGQNTSNTLSTSGKTVYIGSQNSGNFFDGYMAEFVFIDGQQLDATSFGEFDSTTGIWKPKKIGQQFAAGGGAGTNGFYLDFKDSSNLGNDASGNNNDFTVNNLTSIDQATDTCVENCTTLNPLANLTGSPTYSEGNLKVAGDSSANHNWQTTFVVSSGKWYWELKDLTSSPDGSILFYDQSISSGSHPGYGFVFNTRKKVINGSPTGSAIGSSAQNDIWSMALDLDNGKMFIARNGTYLSSGDPGNGTNPFIQTSDGLPSEGVFGGHIYNGSMELNFGGGTPTSISSGNADANGFGNFEYAVPSGFFALNTSNLNTYG